MDTEEPMVDEMAEEAREAMVLREEARKSRLQGLTLTLLDKRKRSIDWRQSCGIEQEWSDSEDSYEGIDDANRSTASPVVARMQKPRSPNGGSHGPQRHTGTRSTVFLNITRPYTDAAAARVADMLLPTDDRNFAIKPTPIPEIGEMAGLNVPPEHLEDFKRQIVKEAEARADSAQTQIDDWLTECLYHAEVRKVIEDCARMGSGILKGPTPFRYKRKMVSKDSVGGLTLIAQDEIRPCSKAVSPWNIYPEPNCGESLNDGSYLYEKDMLSRKKVRDLIGQPGYIDDQLKECLKEGADRKQAMEWQRPDVSVNREDENFEVWYFSGEITREDMAAAYPEEEDEGDEAIKIVATVINDRIVKIARSPLDCDGFGYDLMPWQRRSGLPWGIGVAKQIDVPQRMLNAATRNMNDNAALSNGPQIVLMRGVVQPADGVFELVPRKVWLADPESAIDDIRKAFMTFDIPTQQTQLMNIIQFALKVAEDVTGLPMLMQGNQGKAPDTVGGMEILNTNANTVLRRIARTFDDTVTEPHIRRYYEWIMLYGKEDQKGDYKIDARGSTSLVERDIQRQAILGMGQLTLNPAFGLDPEMWAEEALRANKITPEKLKLTDEKKKAQQEAMAAQQEEQMKAMQAEMDMRMKEIEAKFAKIQADQQIAAGKAQVQLEANRQDNVTDLTIARERNRSAMETAAMQPAQQPAQAAGGGQW